MEREARYGKTAVIKRAVPDDQSRDIGLSCYLVVSNSHSGEVGTADYVADVTGG